jgi:hypothetical protein
MIRETESFFRLRVAFEEINAFRNPRARASTALD